MIVNLVSEVRPRAESSRKMTVFSASVLKETLAVVTEGVISRSVMIGAGPRSSLAVMVSKAEAVEDRPDFVMTLAWIKPEVGAE